MPRRTPIIAIILAPLVLYLLAFLWKQAIVPLYLAARYSDTVMEWRLDGAQPASRIAAIKDIGSSRAADTRLFDDLVISLRTDESQEVRKTAAAALGGHGSQQPLSDDAVRALGELVLTEQDDAMLSAAVIAVGQSASNNRYPDEVVERIAAILGEKHLAWLYSRAAMAIGQLGAAQPLADSVVAIMNSHFAEPQRPGEREYVADAFVEMAKGGRMPTPTLDMLAAGFAGESNYRIRRAIIYTLAHAAAGYPDAATFLTAATGDPHKDVVSAAEHGLRIIENERRYAGTDPLSLATDASRRTDERLQALQIIRGTRIDPTAYERLAALARDGNVEVAVAAIDMFRYMASDADGEFEQRVVIPELSRAMAATDPRLRTAAFGVLSQISRYRTDWLHAADFATRLEAGANDPDPKVRVVVLVLMLREAGGASARDTVIERGVTDPDPYVRANVVSWLGSPKTKTSRRDEFIARALEDPDGDVRATAESSRQNWETRDRAWPVEAWRLLRAGEVGQVGMTVLIAVTVATPALICAIFLIYFTARLLTYLQQRRRRAVAVVVVMAIWAAASYGVFMLLFVAGLAGNADAGEIAILAGILWSAIVLYGALGWGMHYVVRR